MESEWLTTDVYTVDKRDRLTKVLGWIGGDRRDLPVVCDGGRPYGIVDARRIMDGRPQARSTIAKVDWPVGVVKDEDSPETALRHFAHSNAPYLPAHVDRQVCAVTAERLLDAFEEGPTAEAAMGGTAVLGPTSQVEDALQAFRRNALTALPYVDGGGPRGVVHRRDMVQYFLEPEQNMRYGDISNEREPVRDDPLTGLVDARILVLDPGATFDEARAAVQKGPAFIVRDGRVEGALSAAYLLAGLHEHRKRQSQPAPVRHAGQR